MAKSWSWSYKAPIFMKVQDVIPILSWPSYCEAPTTSSLVPSPSHADWGSLPDDFLVLILDNVLSKSVHDYIRCATVCKSWYRCCARYLQLLDEYRYGRSRKRMKMTRQLPLLLTPTVDDGSETLINLPYDCRRYCGSSHGWMIFVQDTTLALKLFNPFTGATIHLPPPFPSGDDIINVVISDDPSSNPDNYEVLVQQFGGRLALFSSSRQYDHGKRWIYADNYLGFQLDCFREDHNIVYLKGKFHAMIAGKLASIEIDIDQDTMEPYIRLNPVNGMSGFCTDQYWAQSYLAESISGTLLYIHIRWYPFSPGRYHKVTVWELEEIAAEGITRIIPVGKGGERELGDQALFLGYGHSSSVRASDFPGCIPNSIYFTHDYSVDNELGPAPVDIRVCVYTLRDEHVKPLYKLDTSPIWIT